MRVGGARGAGAGDAAVITFGRVLDVVLLRRAL